MSGKFNVQEEILALSTMCQKEFEYFPKKHIELKARILNTIYDVLQYVVLGNNLDKRNQREVYINKAVGSLEYFASLMLMVNELKILGTKILEKINRKTMRCFKLLAAWRRSELKYVDNSRHLRKQY